MAGCAGCARPGSCSSPRRPNAGRPSATPGRGVPAWDSLYAEDQDVNLFDALARPWHLLVPYGGYGEFVPRLVGQLISATLWHRARLILGSWPGSTTP